MISPDGRWVLAQTTGHENKRVADVWPRLACIGDALDSNGTKQEADCVAYVRHFVLRQEYFTFGNAKDAGGIDIWNESPVANTVVRCHQLKDDERN
jgi:hypothetical protein